MQANKLRAFFLVAVSFSVFAWACSQRATEVTNEDAGNQVELLETLYRTDLKRCIAFLDTLSQSATRPEAEAYYQHARTAFKHAEPILAFVDVENYKFLNQPNILKVEEEDATDIKIKKPSGFQVLEETIFSDEFDLEAVRYHANLTKNRLKLIEKNTAMGHFKPYHVLWVLQRAISRVALTGITGFDSPVLENSLSESATVYERLQEYLTLYQREFQSTELYDRWNNEFSETLQTLQQGDFSSFDRYAFIQQHTHRQLALLTETATDWQVTFPFTLALDNNATSLFSSGTFNTAFFSDPQSPPITPEKVTLGKALFNDARLSKGQQMSCGTCHQAELAFTDGKKISDGQTRNSPTLTYAHLQQAFFYDNRAGSLEGQIVSVVESETEFHSDLALLTQAVQADSSYANAFATEYPEGISEASIRHAIATYIRSLAPFDSKFDRNINGLENSLTDAELQGFNLFMGKAKCATCHFAPVFNGTVPPNFTETEMELLGTPAANDTANATIDPDLGRFYVFNTEERKYFFKTPTVRNVARTAPYMHNGVYETLEEVVDFYNRGGGYGIGIEQPYQTLPPDPLGLTAEEQAALVAFMETLTDRRFEKAIATVAER